MHCNCLIYNRKMPLRVKGMTNRVFLQFKRKDCYVLCFQLFLFAFFSACFFFDFSRRSMAAREGFVRCLVFGRRKPAANMAKKRLITNCLFRYWLRDSSACIKRRPFLFKRFSSLKTRRCFSASESPSEAITSKESSTFVATLLTC